MTITTGPVAHLALRVTDLDRSARFYTEVLGFPQVVALEGLVLVNANGTVLGLRGTEAQSNPGDRFDPFRVGLDHLALALPDGGSLEELAGALDAAGVRNNGVEHDELTNGDYIAFYDPDGIAWEIYSMPAG